MLRPQSVGQLFDLGKTALSARLRAVRRIGRRGRRERHWVVAARDRFSSARVRRASARSFQPFNLVSPAERTEVYGLVPVSPEPVGIPGAVEYDGEASEQLCRCRSGDATRLADFLDQ